MAQHWQYQHFVEDFCEGNKRNGVTGEVWGDWTSQNPQWWVVCEDHLEDKQKMPEPRSFTDK